MFDIKRKTIEWAGRPLTLETGRIARQADGAVLATYGETVVLATVVYGRAPKPGLDFFPLTVNYQEKTFAAGKIPGGYFKREGRPTEKETLVSRLIDRPIRPLFVKGFKNETQVVITVLQHDMENDPDVVGMVAASAALTISGVPFMGPIGAARVGYIDGELVLNPTLDQLPDSDLDLVVAGTQDALMMVESEAKELSEDTFLDALMFAHRGMQPVIEAIIDLAEHAAKEPFDFQAEDHSDVVASIRSMVGDDIKQAYTITGKHERRDTVVAAKVRAADALVRTEANPDGIDSAKFAAAFKECEAEVLRRDIIENGHRVDGRALDKVRPIVSEVGVFPRTHGSALFTRGETQAIVVATLGTGEDEQYVDALSGTYKEKFLLHYNFPPYSVGETGRMGGAGRREIGHGKLAWRAIRPMLPSSEEFPYTIRLVSEITESNGSSSMATVCGSSLALMDAGEMDKAIDGARTELGEFAPKIEQIKIPTDKIRDVIGTGGKIIREIVEKTGAKVNIEDDGTVKIAASEQEKIDAAREWIKSLTSEPEVGVIYTGKVVKVVDFGAFVNFFGAKDGLVHVSQMALERVANPADVVSEGQEVKVKFLGMDDRGKTKLSMKVVDQTTGEDITDKINAERAERGEPPMSEDTGGRPRREGGGDRDRGGDRGRRRRD